MVSRMPQAKLPFWTFGRSGQRVQHHQYSRMSQETRLLYIMRSLEIELPRPQCGEDVSGETLVV
eukprot:4664444-Pyramimonas_sp.AAC.1